MDVVDLLAELGDLHCTLRQLKLHLGGTPDGQQQLCYRISHSKIN
jgi:hypothetical protein